MGNKNLGTPIKGRHPILVYRSKFGAVTICINRTKLTIWNEDDVDQLAYALQQMGGQGASIEIKKW